MGWLNDFIPGVSKGAIAGSLGAPVDMAALAANSLIAGGGYLGHKMGLFNTPPELIQNPVGGSEWVSDKMRMAGLLQDNPGSSGDNWGQAAGSLIAPLTAAKAPQIAGRLLGIGENNNVTFGRHFGKIDNPPLRQSRPFTNDYPSTSTIPGGSQLAVDIDGNPLTAKYIAGRRVGGGADEPLSSADIENIATQLGAKIRTSNIGSNLGSYNVGRGADGEISREILFSPNITSQQLPHVFAHETGHLLDDLTFGRGVPQTGVKKELSQVYSDLNSSMFVPKGKIGANPATFGYKGNEIAAELNADAIRAYMQDPNYLKTVAPNVAKRIREVVNSNPNMNKIVQFNSSAGAGIGAGLLGYDQLNSNKTP